MSNDQKPARIRIVSSGALSQSPDTASVVAPRSESVDPAAKPAERATLLPAMLFLGGCVIGGAGLTAWPHFAG